MRSIIGLYLSKKYELNEDKTQLFFAYLGILLGAFLVTINLKGGLI